MSTKWMVDKTHSEVQFKVKHMVISTVTGEFVEFDAEATSQDDSFDNAEFKFSANVGSGNTNNTVRDDHLKGEDFFKSAEFPTLNFTGKLSDGKVDGELTIRGVTKPVTLKTDFGGVIKDPYGNQRAGFEFEGEVNRKDFGLNWNATTEAGGLVVSDKVKLFVNLELIKQ